MPPRGQRLDSPLHVSFGAERLPLGVSESFKTQSYVQNTEDMTGGDDDLRLEMLLARLKTTQEQIHLHNQTLTTRSPDFRTFILTRTTRSRLMYQRGSSPGVSPCQSNGTLQLGVQNDPRRGLKIGNISRDIPSLQANSLCMIILTEGDHLPIHLGIFRPMLCSPV